MPADERARIGGAIRQLRRGAAMQQLRGLITGELDLGQSDALEVIVAAGSCRMNQLADALRIDASSTTRAVDRLVTAGLVQRVEDPADGRAVVVAPTASGRAVRNRIRSRAQAVMDKALAEFSDAERAALAELLERLVAGFDRVVAARTPVRGAAR